MGRRKRGRPKKSWQDEVDKATDKRELGEGDWEERPLAKTVDRRKTASAVAKSFILVIVVILFLQIIL